MTEFYRAPDGTTSQCRSRARDDRRSMPQEFTCREWVVSRMCCDYNLRIPTHDEIFLPSEFQVGKMKLIGDGQKRLSNTSVDDFADTVVLALEQTNACGETLNIRDERFVTRQELISTIADSIGAPYPKSVPVPIPRMLVVIAIVLHNYVGGGDTLRDACQHQVSGSELGFFDRQGGTCAGVCPWRRFPRCDAPGDTVSSLRRLEGRQVLMSETARAR